MKKIFIMFMMCFFLTACTENSDVIYIKKNNEESKEMKVHYINLESGKCTFFELPNGESMLIDAGTTEDFPVVYEYLKNLDVKTVDYMIITANDSYHLGGAEKIIQNFTVCEMYVSEYIQNKSLYKYTANEAVQSECKIHIAQGGTEILTDGDLNISIAAPVTDMYNNSKDYSVSVMISYGNNNFFHEGDCGIDSENDMVLSIGDYLESSVLSVANSASEYTSSTAFLQKVSPKYAVIQVFGENKPEKTILKSFEALGIYILRTDVNGNIVITSNSDSIVNIDTER